MGRNISEAIARLGGRSGLLSIVGADEAGGQLVSSCRASGVAVDAVIRSRAGRTATYTALLDGSGELVGAVADMEIFDELSPAIIREAKPALSAAGLVICDANLAAATLEAVLECTAAASVPAWFEPVSIAKALHGRCSRPWHLATPNCDELLALLGKPPLAEAASGGMPEGLPAALVQALEAGIAEHLLVTLGPRGAVLAAHGRGLTAPRPLTLDVAGLLDGREGAPQGVPALALQVESSHGGSLLWYRLLRPLTEVRDVTGAGDALLAGAACAFLAGWPLEEAVVAGMFCAHITLFTDSAVAHFLAPDLLPKLHRALSGSSRL